jgi:hypothetical protein
VTLTASPADLFEFAGWSGSVSGKYPQILIHMGRPVTLTGSFVRQSGTVQVQCEGLSAPWSLVDGDGQTHNGSGTRTLTGIPTGTIVLTWGDVAGYQTPPPMTRELARHHTATFLGVFAAQEGSPLRGEGQVLRYLLGLDTDPSGLDRNGDTLIDVADLIGEVNTQPPSAPASPLPADGATTQSTQVTLDWADALRATAYDVYLWPTDQSRPAQPTASGLTASAFAPAERLSLATSYSWQVVAWNDAASTEGPVWTFVTRPQVAFVLTPDGGETWTIGQPAQIHWRLDMRVAGQAAHLAIVQNGAVVHNFDDDWSELADKTVTVTVPPLPPGTDYRIRATSIWLESTGLGADAWDESDGTFAIQ